MRQVNFHTTMDAITVFVVTCISGLKLARFSNIKVRLGSISKSKWPSRGGLNQHDPQYYCSVSRLGHN